jgi:hypothetical protein
VNKLSSAHVYGLSRAHVYELSSAHVYELPIANIFRLFNANVSTSCLTLLHTNFAVHTAHTASIWSWRRSASPEGDTHSVECKCIQPSTVSCTCIYCLMYEQKLKAQREPRRRHTQYRVQMYSTVHCLVHMYTNVSCMNKRWRRSASPEGDTQSVECKCN